MSEGAIFLTFLAALERDDPRERALFLDQACGGDAALRAKVDALLKSHAEAGGFVDESAASLGHSSGATPADSKEIGTRRSASVTSDQTTDQPQTREPTDADTTVDSSRVSHSLPRGTDAIIAGRYRLIETIGEGGMGSVYLAEQSEPVRRHVALKLIKSGMDSRAVLARFDAERQALAMMDHPNIARIYDGGLTASGQPFFVMELVKGEPLTGYCDQRRMSIKARLELFVSVCQAVQHAHQKGIIHRDLKPGNVLVTEVDGKPTPKVIDFGVAKATEVRLTDMSVADTGAIVGTPTYMSPEQADPSSMDIDTRTDVYALGVMLYELLTGSAPIDAKQFQRGAMLEMLRMVREVDPPRPSTKLSTAEALPSIAANRQIEPARLVSLVRGELDWIVMKALEKDRDRRYDTANAFARDIQRYLSDEVVEARPPSRGYRLKKFVKRNRGQVIAAGLVLLTLLAGIAGTTFGMIRAEKRRQEAERNLAFAKKGNEILGSVFDGLDPKMNYANVGEFAAVLRDNLKQALKELDRSAIGDPADIALMQQRSGRSLISLGEFDFTADVLEKAREVLQSNLGKDDPSTLTSMHNLALAYLNSGKLDKALALYDETAELRKVTLGPDNPDTMLTQNDLAQAYWARAKYPEAIALYERVRDAQIAKLGPEHPDTLATLCNLAAAYRDFKRIPDAIALYNRIRDSYAARLGPEHPDTLIMLSNLAGAYCMNGKYNEGIPLFEHLRRRSTAKLGPDHPATLATLNSLATAYEGVQRHGDSLPILEHLRDQRTAKTRPRPSGHPDHALQSRRGVPDGRQAARVDRSARTRPRRAGRQTRPAPPSYPEHPQPPRHRSSDSRQANRCNSQARARSRGASRQGRPG